jgi:hypothetical protein
LARKQLLRGNIYSMNLSDEFGIIKTRWQRRARRRTRHQS